jgi:three-Cys-motif partner protein
VQIVFNSFKQQYLIVQDNMSRAAELTAEKFFEKSQPHSIAKANIVADYAIGWAKIIINSRISNNRNPNRLSTLDERACFVDLCCGAGAYDDGEESTPLKIIRGALKIESLKNNLLLFFNDISKEMIDRLRNNVGSINNLDFYHPIKYASLNAASDKIFNSFKRNRSGEKIPTLAFIDPFGYKEISQELLREIISVPQSDIIIFFNYKRINPALDNTAPGFESNMDRLFGAARVQKIKTELETCKSSAREELILRHLEEALKQIGAEYVCPYLVVPEDETHTSHYIVCMSKHPKGFELMKSVMSQHSQIGKSGKAKFGHDPASVLRDNQGSLFEKPIEPAEALAKQLAQKFSGRTLTYGELYDKHQRTTNYTRPEYRQAVQILLKQGTAKLADSANSRIVNGEQTTPPHLKIEFT